VPINTAPLHLLVAGLLVFVDGPEDFKVDVSHHWGALLLPSVESPSADRIAFSLKWKGLDLTLEKLGQPQRRVRIAGEGWRLGATQMLLNIGVQEALSGLISLHGNALLHRESNHLLLLLGESGAGKSTLSRELMHAVPSLQLASEDMILLDPQASALHPFPRAAGLREAPAEHVVAESRRRVGFGDAAPEKWIVPYAAGRTVSPGPIALSGMAKSIILLKGPHTRESAENLLPGSYEVHLTFVGSELGRRLAESGLEVAEASMGETTAVVRLRSEPTPGQWESIELEAGKDGGLILSHGWQTHQASSGGSTCRSPLPQHARRDLVDVIPALLGHVRRPSVRSSQSPAAVLVMALARLLGSAQVWEFEPGGTPAESTDALRRLLNLA